MIFFLFLLFFFSYPYFVLSLFPSLFVCLSLRVFPLVLSCGFLFSLFLPFFRSLFPSFGCCLPLRAFLLVLSCGFFSSLFISFFLSFFLLLSTLACVPSCALLWFPLVFISFSLSCLTLFVSFSLSFFLLLSM